MNVTRSLRALKSVMNDDRALRQFGLPAWRYATLHYEGRLRDRMALDEREFRIDLEYHGKRMSFPLTASYFGAMKGLLLDDEYGLRGVLAEPPCRILDLGANAGMALAVMAAQFPEAAFVAVEPDPRNVARLRRSIDWNGIDGTLIPAAVGPAEGSLRLRFGRNPTCSALETSRMHDLSETVDVDVVTVESCLAARGWDWVDLVKIDIEGAEEALVTENNAWLARAGALIMEIHPSCDRDTIAAAIAPFGFGLERFGAGREPVYLAIASDLPPGSSLAVM